ncbi:UDP-N-acetylglucosamine diphosphorylase [Escherichia coli]|uniref:CDP-glycerol glycerophosphotransferase family protein n=1 Tax=Escherichia coli TaxID=562 RepID=UPI000BA9F751|nr:CDP-glycerol glycerophosphotransferase family protein [Escherichia coli]EHH3929665.1 UDP-N-acetylglucosamine diphosphorylase [Escherichia coli]PAS87705.1 UDP-N-acetylglucosamine diphosphorylase [Escherichia coli]HCP4855016.1 CDP-glycerol glycerophosphotransferase family protein [Escherichia coli]HDC4236514.1 CDP-glycerol glycerophosphotransferase family protein [Escherichia coli]
MLKKYIPNRIRKILSSIKKNRIDPILNKRLMSKIIKKHSKLERKISNQKKLRVVFLVIHRSVWKVDAVFKNMLKNPKFEPIILICPDTSHGDEHMWREMKHAYNYFKEKNYPLISSYDINKKTWITLDTLEPDIIFFTNPHNLTRKEYYKKAYLNYLSCYVPYHHEIVNNWEQYNQQFHIAQWKIFATNNKSMSIYTNFYPRYGSNVKITGYPAMEELINKLTNNTYNDVWKTQDKRLRIIWAPHHSIEMNENVPYSNFMQLADVFKSIAENYKDKVIWSFKPHPLLKTKLYEMPGWGKERTDSYYDFWKNNEYTQLDQGEYVDLFCSSDAMIHDSGSFLAEYLYMKKPVLYILSAINNCQHYSDFGLSALESCQIGRKKEDIVEFIESILILQNKKNEHSQFLIENVHPYFSQEKPSERIIKSILGTQEK